MGEDHKRVIAHLVSSYLFLTGTWIHRQIVNTKRYKPVVLTTKTENLDIFPFEPIFSYGHLSTIEKVFIRLRNHAFNGVYYNFFYGLLRKHKAVLMHCHFGSCGVTFLNVKKKLGLPMVTAFYGFDMSVLPRDPDWRAKYKTLFAEGERFLAEGTHMKKCLVELGCPESKITVQHLGVDLDDFPLVPRRIGPDGKIHILVAASFKEKKGIPYALEAFARVRQEHKNVCLTLVGDSSGHTKEEQEKQKILEILTKHDMQGSVRWLGFQPYPVLREILRTHHLFLSPSVTATDGDTEGGSPVTITEAQATGMPVVSTFHADIPEVVLNGKTGLLSPERDIQALAANLEYLVAHPNLWDEMGRQGRRHIEKEYSISVQVRKLEGIYSAILSGN